MDDLKVVLYIVVAIIWVVYNNYRKLSEASKKRDLKKPPPEVIQENWPRETVNKPGPFTPPQRQIVDKQTSKTGKPVMERSSMPSRRPLKRTPIASKREQIIIPSYRREGGTTLPSKVAHFEEPVTSESDHHPIFQTLKSMDLKHAIVISEILKRPYY